MIIRNVDNINIRIPRATFLAMDKHYLANRHVGRLYINSTDYITNGKYIQLRTKWIAYRHAHNMKRPSAIWTISAPKPKPASTTKKPLLITKLETILGGTINNLTDYYKLIQKHGRYAHYDCVHFQNTNTAISRIRHGGLNCADYTYLTIKVIAALNSMGKNYLYQIYHVECRTHAGDALFRLGHFFLIVNRGEFSRTVNFDVSEASSSRRSIGYTMCTYGDKLIGHTLCFA